MRRVSIAMNTNVAFAGSVKTKPFLYQKLHLRAIRIFRGSHVVDMDTTDNVQFHSTIMRGLKFDEGDPGILLKNMLKISFKCLI